MRCLGALLALSLLPGSAALWADATAASGGDGQAALRALIQPRPQDAAPAPKGEDASQAQFLSGTVTIKGYPTAQGPNVFLSDLIEQNLPPDVGGIAIKPSGAPGSVVDVDPVLVALKLRRAPGGPYFLKPGYGLLRVPVPAQKVAGKVLLDFATAYLQAQLSGTAGVDIEPQGKVFGLNLYDAEIRFRVRPPDDHPLRGYVELRVEVLQTSANGEESVVATVPASFLIHRQEQRLFAAMAINRGDPLGPQNLGIRLMDTTFAPDGFSDPSAVEGRIAKTFIPAGRPLETEMVDLPLAIHAGDMVRLLVRSGAIEVQTSGRAMRDARVGESLPLQIPDTGKQVQARCVDVGVAVQNAW
jgi:flagella basal body P-ring formation protein FlgA